ncbi:uncharacterized protein LOC585630 [Strongylocentrotus purpuratus]|uniref:RING-type domain-containing protein n=1 Tax=Strongylocentrotus purpuratus TaxID=7668 RepID=A0A7M7ND06_STRPU|nr:uncharacterized protein LOC585630 [Strongylocentrotus purpuratus]
MKFERRNGIIVKLSLANDFGQFFHQKVQGIVSSLGGDGNLADSSSPCNYSFNGFDVVSEATVQRTIKESPSKSCRLDPIPTTLLKDSIDEVVPAALFTRKKEVFSRLDDLEKVWKYAYTKLSTMGTDDYVQVTCLLEEVEKVDELQVAMGVAKDDSYFGTFYKKLKEVTKLKDGRVSRLTALVTIKQYWQYVNDTVVHKKEVLATLMNLSEKDEKDMNSSKDKGNNFVKGKRYRNAHDMYTKALAIGVFNHILYSNRCQTALHMEDFWDALVDARRAITIKPDWQEGHYHYAQAFFELKNIDRALHENKRGQELCDDGGSQTGDLQRQATMFNDKKKRLVSLNSKKEEVRESETDSDSDSDRKGKSRKPSKLPDINQDLQKSKEDFNKKKAEEAKKKKEEEVRKEKEVADRKRREAEERERKRQEEQEIRRRQRIMHDVEASNKSSEEDEKRKAERNKRKAEKAERKRKEAEKQAQERVKRDEKEKHAKEKEKQAKREAEIARQQKEQMRRENERLTKERNAIEKCLADGSLALVSGQSRQAITQYDRAAELLKATKKEHYGMHEADYLVFLYAQATAYLKSGIPLEINEALSRFESITKDFPNMRNGLPFYGLATALFKLNRFTEALDPIEKSLFITTRFDQTIHTWPGTSTNIEETEEGKLEAALKELQRWCKNPPSADATCRYMECTSKREMYFSDLDFKGYIKVQCSERCYIDYHINCWKAIKNESNILGEKEALKTKCSTPDCLGTLSYIKVIEGNGIIKTEFKVEKPPKPAKDEAKKKSAPKPTKDQKKGKKFRKYHQSDSYMYKAEKGQGDAEGQPGHGQTAEGAHAEKEDSSSKSAHRATKPRTGSDAGIAAATDSTQNDTSRVQGAEGEAEIKPEATYVLKRDEFDDVEQKKTNKAQPKKSRKPVTLHEEASNIVQFDFGPTTRHLYGADDAEELQERKNRWHSTLTVSEDRPFAIPEYLQDAARKMDASFQKEGFIIVPETDEEKSQKTVLFLHFNDIFSSNGPLYLQDPIITRYMEHLTFEHQELILKRGGLKPFLLESEDMVVIGDYASMKGDAQKCRELAIRNGYQERELSGDVAGYSLNPNSVPFIPGLGGYNPTLSVGLDQFDAMTKRGPVSGLDSFDGDEDSDEEDDNEIKTEESEGTKNESDNDDTTTSSDDEDDDENDDSDDDNDEAEDSFHDASSEMHASNYEGIEPELYQSILEDKVSVPSNCKVDGIDDEDYHWEDHYSSKELTMEEVDDDVVVHGETDKNGEQSHVQRGGEGTKGNTGASNNIESKDTVDSAEGRERQESVTKLPVPSEMDRSDFELIRDGISGCQSEHESSIQSDGPRSVVQESASITENPGKLMVVNGVASICFPSLVGAPTEQPYAESNEMTSELNKGTVNQSVRPDKADSDDGTSVDGVLNPRPDDEVVGASNTKKFEQPISKPVATPVSNSTHVVNTETTMPKVNRQESGKETQELQRTPLSESDYEKMFEKRMQQWKDQQPAVHEQRTFGTNTDDYVNQQMESLQRALEQAENNKKISEARMIEYQQAFTRRANEKIRSLQEKYQKDLDLREKKAKEEKQLLFNSLHQVEAEYLKQNKRLNVLEEYEESRERTKQTLANLNEKNKKLVLALANENDRLWRVLEQAENNKKISKARMIEYQQTFTRRANEKIRSLQEKYQNSVKDKEKTNKMLEKQSKKLTTEKQELHDNVSKLQFEMALLNEDRLTADSRRTQMEKDMEESQKVFKELKGGWDALELRLKARDEEAVKSLGRACKAEIQFLHLFMAKELKPLEEACKEANSHIQTIANILQNNPMMEEHVRAIRSMWQDCLATNQRAASKAQNEFQKQVNAIQNGATLDSMKPVEVPAPYKPEGLVKGASGSPTSQPALTLPSSMAHEPGMAAPAPGSWTMSAPRMKPVDQDGIIAAPTAEGVPLNGAGVVENQPASHTNPEAQRKTLAMAQSEAMAEAQAQAQAQEQEQAQAQALAHAQAQAQAKAKAQQIQQAQAMSRAQTPPVVSQGEATTQQAAMSGNQQSNAIPPNMQHAQHQMRMSQQQGAAARHQHQVQQQQQMLARQQYMEQQVARPKNSFERIMLRLHGFFPNYNKVQLTGFLKEVRTSNNGSLSGLSVEEIVRRVKDLVHQRQRETAGNASQRMQNKGFSNHQGMSGGRPTAPPATFNTQPKRSSYYNAPTPPQPAWSTVGHIQGLNLHKELVDGEAEEEDPCVICHDEMSGDNTLEIECGHIFHIHCLHEWLKQQQTCPTCRNFTILKDDYPSLHK